MACLSPPELPGSQPACERGGLIADAMGGTWEPRLQLNLSGWFRTTECGLRLPSGTAGNEGPVSPSPRSLVRW